MAEAQPIGLLLEPHMAVAAENFKRINTERRMEMKGFDKEMDCSRNCCYYGSCDAGHGVRRTDGHAYRHGRHGTEPTIVLTDSVLQ